MRTRFIATTRAQRAWIALATVLLELKSLIPRSPDFALPIGLPSGRRIMVGDLSELRVLGEIFLDRVYDVAALPPAAGTILDLGANIGAASEFFATRYPSCAILAYEADPRIAARARRNLRGLPVDVHVAAISDSTEPVQLRRPVGMSWATSAYEDHGEPFWVPGQTLDNIIGDRHIDILKLDIEGSEYPALKACTCLNQVDLILGEFHPLPHVSADDFFRLLNDFDLLAGGGRARATFVARRRTNGGTQTVRPDSL